MTIKVRLDTNSDSTYSSASTMEIQDGHLLLADTNGTTVAAIAPGRWHNAELQTEQSK